MRIALLFSIFPGALTWLSDALGVALPVNLLFFVAMVLLVLVAVQLSYELSRHEARIRRLAAGGRLAEREKLRVSARLTKSSSH